MPLEGLPLVRTLAEMYELNSKEIATLAQRGITDDVLREVWMLGAGSVVLGLLRFMQGDAPESDPNDPVARVLEAWDAEVLRASVDKIMAIEASRRSGSEGTDNSHQSGTPRGRRRSPPA
jgi:hypothetical protein